MVKTGQARPDKTYCDFCPQLAVVFKDEHTALCTECWSKDLLKTASTVEHYPEDVDDLED